MLVEGITALTVGGLGYLYLRDSDKRKIKTKWNETLLNCKVEGVRIKSNGSNSNNVPPKTFLISKIYPRQYGFFATVTIPYGLTYSALEKTIPFLKDTFGANIEMERVINPKTNSTYAQVKFIIKDMCNVDFKPYNTESNELLLGLRLDGSPYKMDFNIDTHLLFIGANGTGKSYLLASILTNLFYYNKKHFEIWGMQVKKNDLDVFSNMLKFQAKTVGECLIALRKIDNITNKRNEEFSKLGIKDIGQFNEIYPKKAKKRILVVIEEIFFMMPQSYDDEELQNIKKECLSYFMSIVKAGRSCGCHFIATTQRSTIQNLPSDVKQECSKIALHMKSEANSENAIDIPDARYLKPRQFIFDGNLEVVTITCPKIDKHFKILNSFVPEIKIPKLNDGKDNGKDKTNKTEVSKNNILQLQNIKYTSEKSEQFTIDEYNNKYGLTIKQIKDIKKDIPNEKLITKNTEQKEGIVTSARRGRKKNLEVAIDDSTKR